MGLHDKELFGRLADARYASKPAIRRAIEAARANGINANSIELTRDGSIRISEVTAPAQGEDEFDRLVRQGAL